MKHPTLIISMLIFGSIGIFRKYIPLESGALAAIRGIVGAAFLLVCTLARRESFRELRGKLPWLALSGALIGINWVLLFEAYRYTTVATATLCYYTAPVWVVIASPFVTRERLTPRKIACAACAVVGAVLVSGIFSDSAAAADNIRGIVFGLAAAVFYAAVILTGKKLGDVPPFAGTTVRLASAGACVLVYSLVAEDVSAAAFADWRTVALCLAVGIVHTGIAYFLYFGSMNNLSAQTVALFGYIDPASAVVFSAVILGETLTPAAIVGAVLILASAIAGELGGKRRKAAVKKQ